MVCNTLRDQQICLANQKMFLQIFSFMIDVFTPDFLFKSNHRQVKVSIWIPRFAIYLRGELHTAEIVSAVSCTPRRQLCDRISRRNLIRIQKYLSLFYQGPRFVRIMKKTVGRKSLLKIKL